MTDAPGRRAVLRRLAAVAGLAASATWLAPVGRAASATPLRVAVVGGIRMCGVWDRLAPRIAAATGIPIELAAAAPKVQIVPAFQAGEAELLLIHGGVETFGLQAEGIGGQQRVWSSNEHAIVGPVDDPAGVRGAADAAQAFERIAAKKAPFVAFRDPGSHEMVQNVWKHLGLQATPDWVLLDETRYPQEILEIASRRRAYVVVGAIPAAFEKLRGDGMTVLLKGDPALRRYFVAMEPGPRHPADAAARDRARAVADFLVSEAGQQALADADREAGGPWLFPLPKPGEASPAPAARRGAGGGGGRQRQPG